MTETKKKKVAKVTKTKKVVPLDGNISAITLTGGTSASASTNYVHIVDFPDLDGAVVTESTNTYDISDLKSGYGGGIISSSSIPENNLDKNLSSFLN